MPKLLIEILNLLAIATIVCFPFFNTKGKGILALSVITIQVIICFFVAVFVFLNGTVEYSYPGSLITGSISVKIDYLSAWFFLLISFTFFTGAWYGLQYMKKYINQPNNIALHALAYIVVYTALIDICLVQNGIAMLVLWEIMALSSFIVIIFDHHKTETLKAGINFLIQSHISILFLTLAFMWIHVKTGSFDYEAITAYTNTQPVIISFGLFLLFFVGFGIKAGFVPFHTWLPLAHPAAPAHISGVMSGVIIKIGIYGIFRVLMLLKTDMITVGFFILTISVITGLYGVMLAIVQHNLKKLLAYHSIENIGIIGIGIGVGCLGLGYNYPLLQLCGFGGALLHTLNHSLFKSLLFFSAGNVYQVAHTMNIESLGGLIKKMPRSAFLFLIASLAICGLPPLNGFVSEFFIFSGLFNGLMVNDFSLFLFMLFAILGLVLIGGLALICFTKAFGIVFIGTSRKENIPTSNIAEKPIRIAPLYLIALAILLIGTFPFLLNSFLLKAITLFIGSIDSQTVLLLEKVTHNLTLVGWYSLAFIALIAVLYFIRYILTKERINDEDATWGCGYVGETSRMQYTATYYIRTYRKLAEPILMMKKETKEISGLYSKLIIRKTHAIDKIELWLIDKPLMLIRKFLSLFVFLQNGNIQAYILYGFIFIGSIILLPVFIEKIVIFINFLNLL